MPSAPRLIVFSDTTRSPAESMLARFAGLAHAAQSGTVLFILRDYTLTARARLGLGQALRAMARAGEQSFGLADRADLARALDAQALHLPGSGVPADAARRLLGPSVFLSHACHDPLASAEPGVDALLLSPIFGVRKGRPALGLAALAQACAQRSRVHGAWALYALGGVDASNAARCVAAGALGVAVIGAALLLDPAPLLRALEISRD